MTKHDVLALGMGAVFTAGLWCGWVYHQAWNAWRAYRRKP